MEILICQKCGVILRGKAKACADCGTTISKHSPTALPAISHTSAPLAVAVAPDPLVLEKAVNRYQYRNLFTQHGYMQELEDGNGNGNGNGHSAAVNTWGSPHAAPVNVVPPQPTEIDFATGRPISAPSPDPAPPAAQSKLGSLLGSAASLIPGTTGGAQDVSGLISLEPVAEPHVSELTPAQPPVTLMPESEKPKLVVSDSSYAMPAEAMPDTQIEPQSEPVKPTIEASEDSDDGVSDLPIGGPIPVGSIAPVGINQAVPPLAAAASGFAAGAAAAAIAGALFHSGQSSTLDDRPPDTGLDTAPSQTPAVDTPTQVASFIAEPASNVALAAASQPQPTISMSSVPPLPPPSQEASGPNQVVTGPEQIGGGHLNQIVTGPIIAPPAETGKGDFFAGAPAGVGSNDSSFLPFGVKPVDPAPSAGGAMTEGATTESITAEPAPAPTPVAAAPAPEPVVEAPAPFVAAPVNTGSFFDSGNDFFSQGGSSPAASPFSQNAAGPGATAPASSVGMTTGGPSTGGSGGPDQTMSGAQPSIIAEAIARAQRAAKEGVSESPPPAKKPVVDDDADAGEMMESIKSKSKSSMFDGDKPSKHKIVVNDGDDDDDDEDEEEKDEKPKRRPRLEDRVADDKTINIFGMPMKMQTVMTAGIVIFMVVAPVLGILSTIFGSIGQTVSNAGQQQHAASGNAGSGGGFSFGGGGGQPSGQHVGGKWMTVMGPAKTATAGPGQAAGKSVQGSLTLVQDGEKVQGQGMDAYGLFFVNGVYKNGRLELGKQYVDDNKQARGKPIAIIANVTPGNEATRQAPLFRGGYKYTKRVGFGWRGQIQTFVGEFKGYMQESFEPGTGGTQIASSQIPINAGGGGGKSVNMDDIGKDPKKMHQFFLNVALGIIGVGAFLALISLKLFGPSGMINIWAKQQYIPSQFQSQHVKMVREFGKSLKPGGVPFGKRVDWNLFSFYLPRFLAMPPDIREQNPHILILGGAAKGKSRMMASMVAHDMFSGDRAVVLVDSDGGLVDLLMDWVASHPKGRDMAKRIVVIDPTFGDVDHQIGYNPLEFPEDGDLQNAASAVVFGFKAIYTEPPGSQSQWNQQTANILRNAAILLMANGRTLTDLPTLLAENDFRDVLLEKVERMKNERAEYITLIDAWNNYKRLARTDQWLNWIEPILNRVQPMLGDPRIRPILTKPKGDLTLRDIINDKSILFVKIPQGQLDQNANLLGSLIVSGLKQAALSLSLKNSNKRRPTALYLDEFDSFIEKETFDALTSETKKFQIGLIAATKTLQGLPEDYRNQVVINTGTMCIFALAKKDGDMLGPQMFRVDGRKVKHQTIQNIFNKVNTSPQFELISDEEKLNIDRVVGQEERTFFCYRVGTVAGVFNMRSPDFKDVADKDINRSLVDQIYANRPKTQKEKDKNKKSKELAETPA